jgi:lipoyl(octanoyl) transferase
VVEIVKRHLGLKPYADVWQAMRDFTAARNALTPDELWIVEHPPVYTQGLAGDPQHLLPRSQSQRELNAIPVVQSDRGGQITYHGPGQLVFYPLIDLKRRGIHLKDLLNALEQSVIDLLAQYQMVGARQAGRPGVYVNTAKIAFIGLKIRRGCSYHGLSLNVDMDLAPFQGINPCGYAGLLVTQLRDLGCEAGLKAVALQYSDRLIQNLECACQS